MHYGCLCRKILQPEFRGRAQLVSNPRRENMPKSLGSDSILLKGQVHVTELMVRENDLQKKTCTVKQKHTTEIFEHANSLM